MNSYEVWMEGYSCTGEFAHAQFKGTYSGETFVQAAEKWALSTDSPQLFNKERLTYWGCQLFDNEDDARASFG